MAAAKVLEIDRTKVQIRLAKTGKAITTEKELNVALEKEADAMGILRLFAVPRGVLVLGR